MLDWNSNPVFGGHRFPFPRDEASFDREKLARQLENWSLGRQDCLINSLSSLSVPTLYLAGEEDAKACRIAREAHCFSQVDLIPNAAHRIPWDNPTAFSEKILKFIKEIL